MNTFHFEKESVNLGDSVVVILPVGKHVSGERKCHIETSQIIYVENQLAGYNMFLPNTGTSI